MFLLRQGETQEGEDFLFCFALTLGLISSQTKPDRDKKEEKMERGRETVSAINTTGPAASYRCCCGYSGHCVKPQKHTMGAELLINEVSAPTLEARQSVGIISAQP